MSETLKSSGQTGGGFENLNQPPFDPQAAREAQAQRRAESGVEDPNAAKADAEQIRREWLDQAVAEAEGTETGKSMKDVLNAVRLKEYYIPKQGLTGEEKERFIRSADRGQLILDRAEQQEEKKKKKLNKGDTLEVRVMIQLRKEAIEERQRAAEAANEAQKEANAEQIRREWLDQAVAEAEGTETGKSMKDVLNAVRFKEYYIPKQGLTGEAKERFLRSVDRGYDILGRAKKQEEKKKKPLNKGETLEVRTMLELQKIARMEKEKKAEAAK